MKLEELKKYKKILILGYGKEGRASEEYLKTYLPQAMVDHADVLDGDDYLDRQKQYDLVIKTPGIPKRNVTVPYTTATNIFFANCEFPVIGVTGSKGKSTTSSLIYHILKSAHKSVHLVGNIGNPALHELLDLKGKNHIFVMELSSYQLDDIAYSPYISVILNIFPEHMNYHGTVESYYQAKHRVIAHAGKDSFFFYHPKYPKLIEWAKNASCIALPYLPHDIPVSDQDLLLKGNHNKENIQSALCVADVYHIPQEIIIHALKTFQPLHHRLENIGTYKDITFYDDAISTTPESTIAALTALAHFDTIFLGGQDRGYDFSTLADIIIEKGINNIVLFPDSGQKIYARLLDKNYTAVNMLQSSSIEEAVRFAYKHTKKKGI